MINLKYLKQKRNDMHLSQDYMAKKLGYTTRGAYYQLEKGRKKLTLETFLNIAKILDLDLAAAIKAVATAGGEDNVK